MVQEPVNSSTFHYWKSSLDTDNYTDAMLIAGIKRCEDHKGYFTLSNLREYCREPKTHAAHKQFVPALPAPKSDEARKIAMENIRKLFA